MELPEGATFVELTLSNDRAGESGTDYDRNIFVLSASIDGIDVPLADMTYTRADVATAYPEDRLWIPLYRRTDAIRITLPAAEKAAEPPSQEPAKPGVEKGELTCQTTEVAIIGFKKDSAALSSEHKRILDSLIDEVPVEGCSATVVGYASHSGPVAWNRRLALMRSRAVLNYMVEIGGHFVHQEAIGAGATSSFGLTCPRQFGPF